jgi:hypothetical protein
MYSVFLNNKSVDNNPVGLLPVLQEALVKQWQEDLQKQL